MFEPVILRGHAAGDESQLVDGALAARFPVQLVPSGSGVVGFRLALPQDAHEHRKVRGPASLAAAVTVAGMRARETLPTLCREAGVTISIEIDRSPLDFEISPADALAMFDQGYVQAAAVLELV